MVTTPPASSASKVIRCNTGVQPAAKRQSVTTFDAWGEHVRALVNHHAINICNGSVPQASSRRRYECPQSPEFEVERGGLDRDYQGVVSVADRDDRGVLVWLTNNGLRSTDTELSLGEIAEILTYLAEWASDVQDPLTMNERLAARLVDLTRGTGEE